MFGQNKLDNLISGLLAVGIASAFFILPSPWYPDPLPQPFYFIFAIALLVVLVKLCHSSLYRKNMYDIVRSYFVPFGLLFFFILVTALFSLTKNAEIQDVLHADILRIMVLVAMFLVILGQGKEGKKYLTPILVALLISLTLLPALIITDINKASAFLPTHFFSNYTLQGLQGVDPTSLVAWIIIPFAFCIAYFFLCNKEKKVLRIICGLGGLGTMALIWWTNSRGGLMSAILTICITGFLSYRRKKMNLFSILIFSVFIIVGGLIILPHQAKTAVFARYYPQYYQQSITENFKTPTPVLVERVTTSIPTFTANQNRAELWRGCPVFIAAHPLGIDGPIIPLPFDPTSCTSQHNSIFQAAFWGGWGAMFVIVWFLMNTTKIVLKLIKEFPDDPIPVALCMAFLGTVILAMLNNFLQLKTFWLVPAVIVAYSMSLRVHSSVLRTDQ